MAYKIAKIHQSYGMFYGDQITMVFRAYHALLIKLKNNQAY